MAARKQKRVKRKAATYTTTKRIAHGSRSHWKYSGSSASSESSASV